MEKLLSAFLTHRKPIVRLWAKDLLDAGETHGTVYDTHHYYKVPKGRNVFVVTLELADDPESFEAFEKEAIYCAKFDCSDVRSASKLPKTLPYCEFLDIRDTEISKIPKELPHCTHLWCDRTKVAELPELSKCYWLACIGTPIVKLPSLPACSSLSIQCTNIKELPDLLSCRYLFISSTKIISFPELPACEWICCDSCDIEEIPHLRNGTNLICAKTKVKVLPEWNYKYLDCSHTEVYELPDTLLNCETLYCSFTKIKALPRMPKLRELKCESTKISDFSGIPESCRINRS